ncbi:MAG TPA: hypothetical protein ENK31_06785 [Nannocystis exedens]|nr:hypothetical protein [Nannocystis exedens]
MSVLRALPLLLLLGSAETLACRTKAQLVEAEDDPKELIADTDAVCTAMAGGDLYAWRRARVHSATWSMLIARAQAGDGNANCEAAKLIDRRWKQTLTCTAALATGLAERSRCVLPGRP